MSDGHGSLGLIDRLKVFADLAGAGSEVSRRPYLELRLGLSLQGWTASGSNWTRTVTAAELTYAGVIRPIVGAESMIHPRRLTRMERVSDMVAGTWHLDDAALIAGGSTTMTVRLPTATDPDDSTAGLVAFLLFTFGGGDERGNAEVHPLLGDNKFLNPGFEEWSVDVPPNPVDWTEVGAGAVQETTIVLDGLSSARIGSASIGAAAFDGIQQAKVGIQGAYYRVSGYYRTPLTGQSASVEARLRVGDGASSYLLSDGMGTTVAAEGFRIADTYGERRRFLFDCRWSEPTTAALQAGIFLKNTAGSAQSGFLYADHMSFKRIHRWSLYELNLSAAAIPELSIQSQSINFGPHTVGFGSVTLIDGDGELAKALAQLLVLQKPAQVYVGGSFRNGDEIHREDWRGVFPALIRKPEVSPGQITLELENAKALTLTEAPDRAYKLTGDLTTMSRSQENQTKPWVFGAPRNDDGTALRHTLPGVRVALTADGFGEYEPADPFIPVRDNVDVDIPTGWSLKTFPNKELADRNLQGREVVTAITSSSVANPTVITTQVNHGAVTGDTIEISGHAGSTPTINGTRVVTVTGPMTFTIPINVTTGGTGGKFRNLSDYTLLNNKTRIRVLRDIRDGRYDRAGNDVGTNASFDFDTGGVPLVSNIDISGPAYKRAADLQQAMRTAIGGGDTTTVVTVAENTHLFRTRRTSGTLNLLPRTGPNAHKKSWELLGYDTGTDKTGTNDYTAEEATFTDADTDHVIRFTGGGYRDDAAGSICGVANVAIDSWPAIASWLLQKRYNVPASEIDIPSFKAARETSRSTDFAIVAGTFEDQQGEELLAIAERVSVASIVPDGEGLWHCIKHAAGTAGAREFFDEDYIAGSWRMWLDPTAVFREVRVLADWNASLKRFMTYGDASGVLDTLIPLKHGDERVLEILSYIERQYIVGGTQKISNYYGRLIGKIPRVVSFESTSKLVDLLPGHKVILNRTGPGVLDPTGALTAVGFRIADLTKRLLTTGITRCVAVENVQFLT